MKYQVRKKSIRKGVFSEPYFIFYTPPGGKRKGVSLNTTDKGIAERKAAKMIAEFELDYSGLPGHSPTLRAAKRKSVLEHCEDFLADLKRRKLAKQYLSDMRNYLKTVCAACSWRVLVDIRPDAFISWRNAQTIKGRTLNKYLAGWKEFLDWLKDMGRIIENPLMSIKPIDVRAEQPDEFRALTLEELRCLVSVLPPELKSVAYLSSCAGLRWGEISKLTWCDFSLQGDTPFVRVRAHISKNRKEAAIPLRAECVSLLLASCPADERKGLVFPALPRYRSMKKYFKLAGIPYKDEDGRRATFHSLRKSLATMMANAGVPERPAEEVMRHSKGMTYHTYADASLFPKKRIIDNLPSLELGGEAQKKAQKTVFSGRSLAHDGAMMKQDGKSQVAENEAFLRDLSRSGVGGGMVGATGLEPVTFTMST